MDGKKIVIASLLLDENLGEELYTRSLARVLRACAASEHVEIELVELDLKGRERVDGKVTFVGKTRCNLARRAILKVARRVCWRLNRKDYLCHIEWKIHPNNERRLEKYYADHMRGASLLIFGGGGILECSLLHDYYHAIDLITRLADNLSVPVCFNAVGRVVDERYMFGWSIMKHAVNRHCVKSMTCRDGTEWINRNLYGGREFAAQLPCSAILCAQAFGIKRNEKSNTIGIGVIRGSAFEGYGRDFSQAQLLDLYEDVVRALVVRGYECCIFSNGYSGDICFGELLATRLGSLAGVRYALKQRDTGELLRTIASCKALFTARLHSAIAAYSLDIPAVALSWNEKIPDFMKLVGVPERAISMADLRMDAVVAAVERAIGGGYSLSRRAELERDVRAGIQKLLSFAK